MIGGPVDYSLTLHEAYLLAVLGRCNQYGILLGSLDFGGLLSLGIRAKTKYKELDHWPYLTL
jgi:hypothetical protein